MSQASCFLLALCLNLGLSFSRGRSRNRGVRRRPRAELWELEEAQDDKQVAVGLYWTCRTGGKAEERKKSAEGDDWASIRSGRFRSHYNEITRYY